MPLPFSPRKQTLSGKSGRSEKGQLRKSPFSFDHLIGAAEQHRWYFETKSF